MIGKSLKNQASQTMDDPQIMIHMLLSNDRPSISWAHFLGFNIPAAVNKRKMKVTAGMMLNLVPKDGFTGVYYNITPVNKEKKMTGDDRKRD